jgi:hypothetical protein
MTAVGLATFLMPLLLVSAGCPDVESFESDEDFPRLTKSMFPPDPSLYGDTEEEWQNSSGIFTGFGPKQPVEFPHYRHVTELGMDCQYCHTAARKSIHGGVPETQTCMNCHQYVMSVKDKPEIKKVLDSYAANEPIAWKKVHDLPDFVHFSHKRHVQGGVQCTECHGQVGLQGQVSTWSEDDGHGSTVQKTGIRNVMIRETSLQMGWCLDCHASHPSIDKNYGDQANLRRAELKDCWTCHK